MTKSKVMIGELEFEKIEGVTIVVRPGRGKYTMLGLYKKDGTLVRMVAQKVPKWFGEEASVVEDLE